MDSTRCLFDVGGYKNKVRAIIKVVHFSPAVLGYPEEVVK